MRGIAAEKLSSHKSGMTVNPGEEMTFTFRVYNSNEHEVSLNITDIVPENTTYVSGADVVSGNNLSWNTTIPADSTVEKTYTVMVNKVTATPDAIVSGEGATVGGISVKCHDVKIKRTFVAEKVQKISQAIDEAVKTKKSAIERANFVYEKELGKENVFGTQNIDDFKNKLFENAMGGKYILKNESVYASMVPDYLYGGRMYQSDTFEYKRVRLVREQNLIVGDVIFVDDSKTKNMYIYNGNEIIDLTSGEKLHDTKSFLEKLIGCKNTFAVLRPSMVY